MWICICNSISSKNVDEAKKNGVKKCGQLFKYFNKTPKCGKCRPTICKLLEENDETCILSGEVE